MSTEGTDQHHDIEGIDELEWMNGSGDISEKKQSNFFDPVIDDFKVGLLYESFVACVRSHSAEAREKFFNVTNSCTFVLRASNSDIDLFNAGIEYILEGNFRQQYHGNRPQNSLVQNFEVYALGSKKSTTDLLSLLFENSRVFIFATPEHEIPLDIQSFIDADIELKCTPAALERAVKKYVDPEFYLTPEIGRYLMQVPLSQLVSIFSKGRSTGQSILLARAYLNVENNGKIARTKSDYRHEKLAPTLDDLHGLGAAGDWGRDLAMDLADWQAGKISWNEIDRGILLAGAPGTGKTTFAAALARTCGVNLVHTSMSQWQAKGHLGDYLAAMRKSFAEAQKQAPCILFLDEFDSAGDRNSKASDNDDYIRRAVNGLLECLDGASGREGVVVVGATNFPDKIDTALRRPGRLDKLVEIPLPDASARDGILRFHLRGDLEGIDLSPVVARTHGMAGAWLEALVRNARRTARRARREMVLADLMSALPARAPMPAPVIAMSSVHEAGHAVVALESGKKVAYAEVTREVLVDSKSFDGGCVSVVRPDAEVYLRSKSQILIMIHHLLGGLAAEEVFFGECNDGGESDLKEATYWAARMWLATGQQDTLTSLASSDIDPVLAALKTRPDVQKRVEELLQQCMSEVKTIITRRRADVRTLADALIQRGRLSGDEINELLSPKPRQRLRLLKSMQQREEDIDFGEIFDECARY